MSTRLCCLRWMVSLALAACTGEISDPPRALPTSPNVGTLPGAGPASMIPGSATAPGAGPSTPGAAASGELPAPRLRRLTLSQYENSVRDLLGVTADTSMLTAIPPLNGMRAIGASTVALPQRDVEVFETLASTTSARVFGDPAQRQKLTGCDAKQVSCAEGFVVSFGERIFRRALTDAERTRYLGLLRAATQQSNDGWIGLRVVTQAFLQSPGFLYRAELGEPDPRAAPRRTLSNYEVASRLSFFLWNTTPDTALLAAAASGELATPAGLGAQLTRLVSSPRAIAAIDELFADYLQLDALDALVKLPEAYPNATATLPAAMKQETLLSLRDFLWADGGDFREIFTSERSFVNGELARLYGLRAAAADSFSEISLPATGPRAGLLTQASFLALHAHPGRSSPTLRGKFIRENLLCQAIPAPPPDVNTSLPAIPKDAMTARDRLTQHRANPSCAGCHSLMDPLGLALEQFDGIGAYRQTENGKSIDPSGELDGIQFSDARGLAEVLAMRPGTADCFVRTVLRYARGALENDSEAALLAGLGNEFQTAGFRLPDLLSRVATEPSFRQVGALQ